MPADTVTQVPTDRVPRFRRYAVQITPVMGTDPATGRTVSIHIQDWSLTRGRYLTRRRALSMARLFRIGPPAGGFYYTGRAVELVPARPNGA